jgi:hypothetical protein
MAQFDVFVNPVGGARRIYPFVVSLQSNLTLDARDQLVAPLVPSASMRKIAGRLTPVVEFHGSDYVVVVPAMIAVRTRDLPERGGELASARSALLAAIDYLFFGV